MRKSGEYNLGIHEHNCFLTNERWCSCVKSNNKDVKKETSRETWSFARIICSNRRDWLNSKQIRHNLSKMSIYILLGFHTTLLVLLNLLSRNYLNFVRVNYFQWCTLNFGYGINLVALIRHQKIITSNRRNILVQDIL